MQSKKNISKKALGEILKIGKEKKRRICGLTNACVLEAAFGQPREGNIIPMKMNTAALSENSQSHVKAKKNL